MKDRLKSIIDIMTLVHKDWDGMKDADRICALGGGETLLNSLLTEMEARDKVVTSGIFSEDAIGMMSSFEVKNFFGTGTKVIYNRDELFFIQGTDGTYFKKEAVQRMMDEDSFRKLEMEVITVMVEPNQITVV